MKLYDLGKNHCDYFNQFIPNPAQPEPKPDEESRDEGVGSEKQNDQIQKYRLYYCQHREIYHPLPDSDRPDRRPLFAAVQYENHQV